MARPKFEYYAPETLEEACRLLSEKGGVSYVLAGGTDLMVKVSHRLINPGAVIGLKGVINDTCKRDIRWHVAV